MTTQRMPKKGEIVIFTPNTDDSVARSNSAKECVAIITQVWSYGCVNIKIVPDHGPMQDRGSVTHKSLNPAGYHFEYQDEYDTRINPIKTEPFPIGGVQGANHMGVIGFQGPNCIGSIGTTASLGATGTPRLICNHMYSKTMNQAYPRVCISCVATEKEEVTLVKVKQTPSIYRDLAFKDLGYPQRRDIFRDCYANDPDLINILAVKLHREITTKHRYSNISLRGLNLKTLITTFLIDKYICVELVFDAAGKILGLKQIDPVTILPTIIEKEPYWIQYPDNISLKRLFSDAQIAWLSFDDISSYDELIKQLTVFADKLDY